VPGETETKIKDTTANPAPLGLLGFGMTTILLNLHNANFFAFGTMIVAMGIFYGGLAQVFAGIMEWKKGNTFGTVAFTSYGLFWLTLVGLLEFPAAWGGNQKAALVAYFVAWGVFTAVMFIGTLKLNKALQVVFGTLAILFFMLAIAKGTGNVTFGKVTGWEGIICGASAVYAAFAQVLNEVYGKVLLPLGPVTKK
jgi:succinate-acetate transporter protein